jgi:hypothetical protein
MMASVSDNIRTLTGVFTTPSPNHDDPASFNWLPDADALWSILPHLVRNCGDTDKAPPQSN